MKQHKEDKAMEDKEVIELKKVVSELTAITVKLTNEVVDLKSIVVEMRDDTKDIKKEVFSFKGSFNEFINLTTLLFQVVHAGAINSRVSRFSTKHLIGFVKKKDMDSVDKEAFNEATDFYSKFIEPFKVSMVNAKNSLKG